MQPASAQADITGLVQAMAQAMAQALAPLIDKMDEREWQAQEREQEREKQAQEREQEREKQAQERHRQVLRSLGELSETVSATLEHMAADALERRLSIPVRQNVVLTGTKDAVHRDS